MRRGGFESLSHQNFDSLRHPVAENLSLDVDFNNIRSNLFTEQGENNNKE